MDAAKLQQKVYAGYAKAALRIGPDFDLYRPSAPDNPLDAGNKVATLPASFNAEDMKYGKPNKQVKPTWYVLIDGRITQVGDYLQNSKQTFFIAAQQTILPILAVECNRIISILRPAAPAGVGQLPYNGNIDATEVSLMENWPASVLQGTKGEAEKILPGDTRNPWWAILLPYWSGVTLRSADIITDDLERRYVVSSAELTDLGWRLTCAQAQT